MRGRRCNSLAAAGSLAPALIGSIVGGPVDARGPRHHRIPTTGWTLARLAVAGTKIVAPEAYRDASAAAARGALPLEIALQRTAAGTWTITEVNQAWRCRRGAQPDRLGAVLCP